MSVNEFNAFLSLVMEMMNQCYVWLSSITIAGISLFMWLVCLTAFALMVSIIHTFAAVGHVSVGGVAERIKHREIEKSRAKENGKGGK